MTIPRPLPASFFVGETVLVARALIGCLLWRRDGEERMAVRIVETEAYLGANDPASHARGGLRSQRNESMYLQGGHAYVYFTYGMHFCLNVVTAEDGIAEAVLIRAGEPLVGIESMRARRPAAKSDLMLTSGPARLCQALGIDRALDGVSFKGPEMVLTKRDRRIEDDQIGVTPRVGVDYAGDAAAWPLRFFLQGSAFVSRTRRRSAT
jgi:DNA-3-methyladenine glycosylase